MTSGAPFTAACVQLRTGNDVAANIDMAADLIREAHRSGAQFIATPEMTHVMEVASKPLFAKIVGQEDDPGVARFSALAKELGVWLEIGSLAIRIAERQAANRCFVFGPDGGIAATYDKIHMFDVDLASGESYRESKNFRPGRAPVVVDLPWMTLGLTICYDVRFAYLYRALAHAGATLITVPAAFTQVTGEAHWHTLLRARAIETGCFVMAPAQGGTHENGRRTFGHSLIVSPWGAVLAEGDQDPGVVMAEIDPELVGKARSHIPSLKHDVDIQS